MIEHRVTHLQDQIFPGERRGRPRPQLLVQPLDGGVGRDARLAGTGIVMRRWERSGRLGSYFRMWASKLAWSLTVTGTRMAKRILDVIVATLMLTAMAPLMLLVALLIKLTDGGPAIILQTRVGRWGRTFQLPKFRSMVVGAEQLKEQLANIHGSGITFKMRRDPRVTWIGQIIRRTSIDELPQLWCVLLGDMTLVGPRPPVPSEVAQYSLAERRRLEAIPGLTCIWQVSGRAEIPFPLQVQMDVEYIETQSLTLDVKLLAKTIGAVLTARGAY